jgi:hypothetical protein
VAPASAKSCLKCDEFKEFGSAGGDALISTQACALTECWGKQWAIAIREVHTALLVAASAAVSLHFTVAGKMQHRIA